MRWLALYLPQLPLEVFSRGRRQGGALAVVEPVGGRERVCRCDAAAASYGVQAGQALPTALALCTGLAVQRRDRAREQRALEDLAAWAYQFTPRIRFEPALLLLEVGASLRLFGGLPSLLQTLRQGLDRLGYRVQHAVAPTPMAAGLLARNRPGCEVLAHAALHAAVAELPLHRLTREPALRELVRHIGLERIGEVLTLPRPELARRAGPDLIKLLDRLLGRQPDLRPEWQPPARFDQVIELLGEIGHSTALVFPARRLMVALCGFLRGLGGGTQQLHWRLQHRDRPDTPFELGLLAPGRDPDHMLELFRERCERLCLPAPVVGVGLRVDHWSVLDAHDLALFGDAASHDHALLERLDSRLGGERVRGLRCLADHRPERAWRLCAPGEADAAVGTDARVLPQALAQPPWLLPRPRPLQASRGVPQYGGALRLEGLPERIEAGWWDGFDVSRDYFVAHSPAGERLWVFRDRRGGGWYLHGLFV